MNAPLRTGTMPSVWVARAVLAAATMLALLAGVPEGYTPSLFVIVVVSVGTIVAVFRPEHLALAVTMGVVIVWWALQVRSDMPVAALAVAAGLIVAHVAATLLSYGPPNLAVDPALAVLWGMRAVMAWSAALGVWVVARAYAGHGSPELFWLAGLAAATAAAVVGAVAAPIRAKESR